MSLSSSSSVTWIIITVLILIIWNINHQQCHYHCHLSSKHSLLSSNKQVYRRDLLPVNEQNPWPNGLQSLNRSQTTQTTFRDDLQWGRELPKQWQSHSAGRLSSLFTVSLFLFTEDTKYHHHHHHHCRPLISWSLILSLWMLVITCRISEESWPDLDDGDLSGLWITDCLEQSTPIPDYYAAVIDTDCKNVHTGVVMYSY